LFEALQVLTKHKIYSVPVMTLNGKFMGMVSHEGIINTIVQLFAEKGDPKNEASSKKIQQHKFTKKDINDVRHEFERITLKDSNSIVFCNMVPEQTKIEDAIQMILQTRQRLIVGNGDKITNIISPYLLIEYISKEKDHPALKMKLNESSAKITTPVQSIDSSFNVISAFALMIEFGFSGLAVVDEQTVVTVISLKDISLASTDFHLFLDNVEDYVKKVRQSVIETTYYPTINVAENDTVSNVCQKFLAVKSHRVFVRNATQIYGILTVSDFLRAFTSGDYDKLN